MPEEKVFDKAAWHFEGNYPEDLPDRNAYTHSGMFLGWLIKRELLSDGFREDWREDIERFRRRELTAGALFEIMDGVFESSMLCDEGARFTEEHFDSESGSYLSDYESLLANDLPTLYHVEDNWPNFDKLAARMDQRFAQWRRDGRRPWWRFWSRRART
ncbi:MAG: hypothetical protein H6814_00645 [Phycisphaeraceae bacterium]|nr:hypothetical protein [Phycisphaeraceae bacterium]